MINKGMTHYIALHTVNVIQVCLYISVIIIYCLQRLVLDIFYFTELPFLSRNVSCLYTSLSQSMQLLGALHMKKMY